MWKNLIKRLKYFNEYSNPFYCWWKVRKIFKRPKCHFYIGKRTWFFGLPICTDYYNRFISIHISNVGWKWKYDEVRHEWDPYIQIRLFRTWDIILIFNWTSKQDPDSGIRSMSTWEAILDYLYNKKSIKDCIFEHRWSSSYSKDGVVTIESNIKEKCLKTLNL